MASEVASVIGRLLLAVFGMESLTERCPCCGKRRLRRTEVGPKDPIARYLDGEIDAVEMERQLVP